MAGRRMRAKDNRLDDEDDRHGATRVARRRRSPRWMGAAPAHREVDRRAGEPGASQPLARQDLSLGRPGHLGESRCHGIVTLRLSSSAEKAMVKDDIGDVAYVVEVRSAP